MNITSQKLVIVMIWVFKKFIMRTVWMYDGVIYKSIDIAIVNGAKSRRDCLELEMNESESIEVSYDSSYIVLQDEEENIKHFSLEVQSGYLSFADEQNDDVSRWYTLKDNLPSFSSELVQEINREIDRASDEL
jgi:hypothetical protein